jgi:hypothetical protein
MPPSMATIAAERRRLMLGCHTYGNHRTISRGEELAVRYRGKYNAFWLKSTLPNPTGEGNSCLSKKKRCMTMSL